jgi:hypothetical protein
MATKKVKKVEEPKVIVEAPVESPNEVIPAIPAPTEQSKMSYGQNP